MERASVLVEHHHAAFDPAAPNALAAEVVRDYIVITYSGAPMRARLIPIGNSRGLRLAKPPLEEAGLTDEVEIRAQAGALIITAVQSPRAGWAEAARKFGPSRLLDAPSNTGFDEGEWNW